MLAKVSDLLLTAPASPAVSQGHDLLIYKLKHGKEWKRLREQLPADDIDGIGGLLRRFDVRAGRVLVGLLAGRSVTGCAAGAGLTTAAVHYWRSNVPEFGEVFEQCRELGFALLYEAEAESRALAGPDDRGSVRLLEVMLKARGGEAYREKSDVTMRHVKGVDAAKKVFGAMKRPDGSYDVEPTP